METSAYQHARQLNIERNRRAVLRILQGAEDWITDDEIARRMNGPSGERAVRLMVRKLRRDGYPIASESGRGYHWGADDPEAVLATIADLRSRAADMQETANVMERSLFREVGGKKAARQVDAGQAPMMMLYTTEENASHEQVSR